MTGVNPPNYHLLLDPGTVPGRRSGCVPPGPGRPARRTYLIMGLVNLTDWKQIVCGKQIGSTSTLLSPPAAL